jgi:hypothetical protein
LTFVKYVTYINQNVVVWGSDTTNSLHALQHKDISSLGSDTNSLHASAQYLSLQLRTGKSFKATPIPSRFNLCVSSLGERHFLY